MELFSLYSLDYYYFFFIFYLTIPTVFLMVRIKFKHILYFFRKEYNIYWNQSEDTLHSCTFMWLWIMCILFYIIDLHASESVGINTKSRNFQTYIYTQIKHINIYVYLHHDVELNSREKHARLIAIYKTSL